MTEKNVSLDEEDFFDISGGEKNISNPDATESSGGSGPSKKIDCNSSNTVLADDKDIPELRGTGYPQEFLDMTERLRAAYKLLPKINYELIYKELEDLSIQSSPAPTLQVLNDELYKIQAAKDRLSEILIDVIKCYNYKNRVIDILQDSWGKFTSEKNTEGRKGDAAYRISNFLADFAEIEALSKVCNHILKNLDSVHDNLSRRITIWQMILKLRDVGRSALPDIDFSKPDCMSSLFGSDKENDKDENGEPKLRDF